MTETQCPAARSLVDAAPCAAQRASRGAWLHRLAGYWRAETGFFLGVWVALMIAGRSAMFHDPGTFWHTVLGQRVLATGRLVTADPFSFTFGGRSWIPHSWLAECLMAVVHRLGGFDGLLLVTVSILAALYAWAAHRLLRAGLHPLPAALVVALVLASSSMHFHVRPHIATIALLGVIFGALGDFEAGRVRLVHLYWLVPLFVVWSNLHGGMIAGLATLALAVLGWCVAWVIGWESPVTTRRHVWHLGLIVLACGVSALVNPYGLRLPQAWMAIAGSPLLPRIIQEHAPPNPRGSEFWMIVLLGLCYGGTLLVTWPRRPRITWLIPLLWFGLALSRVRNAPLFAITALVALADVLPHSRVAAWLARPGRDLFGVPPHESTRQNRLCWRAAVLPAAVLGACVALQVSDVRAPVLGRGWARLGAAVWPVELLPDLKRLERAHPEGARLFNDFDLGGYVIYHTPGLKVFIDDRCELYGDAWLGRFWNARIRDPARIDGWIDEYDVSCALVRTDSLFDRHLGRKPGWQVIRRGQAATLYQRETKHPRRAAQAANAVPRTARRYDEPRGTNDPRTRLARPGQRGGTA